MIKQRGFKNYYEELDEILIRIAESIQLDETRKKRMESAYSAIEEVMNNDEKFFDKLKFEIYPQGSVKIGTTVKPKEHDEFDLDIVVHIITDWTKYTSSQIYNELKRVLEENKTYKDKVELKNRCIRINYSGDFHMDILPGIQESSSDNGKLKIPDRELKSWTTSNPRGYAEWFLENANNVTESLLEKAFSREDLELEEFSKKKPLKRAVQLLKMYRDEYFTNNKDASTSSIILTTLAAKHYNNSASVYESINHIINGVIAEINNVSILKVVNPKNPEENFSEKWITDSNLYKSFKSFIIHMQDLWTELKNENEPENEKILKSLFSESAYNLGIEAHNKYFIKADKIRQKDFSGLHSLAKPNTPAQKPYIGFDE